ncbi:MAG: acyltransferase [Bryobacteraceae bacterium]
MKDYPARLRAAMLLLNFFPLLHVLATVAAAAVWEAGTLARTAAVLASLYIAPPVLARCVQAAVKIPEGSVALDSRAFLAWWATAQFQTVFNRFPFLEEALRIAPGLYSNWLRLWGSKIGRFTYWAPGTAVLDRSWLDIGDDVVFGAGVRLNGHVLLRNREGRLELVLGAIRIGRGATVGGYSLLTAGTEIPEGESTRACLVSPPFTRWEQGRRVRTRMEKQMEVIDEED